MTQRCWSELIVYLHTEAPFSTRHSFSIPPRHPLSSTFCGRTKSNAQTQSLCAAVICCKKKKRKKKERRKKMMVKINYPETWLHALTQSSTFASTAKQKARLDTNGVYSGFYRIKRLGVFLLLVGMTLVHPRVRPPSPESIVYHLYTWVERDTESKMSCPRIQRGQGSNADRSIRCPLTALIIKPTHLSRRNKTNWKSFKLTRSEKNTFCCLATTRNNRTQREDRGLNRSQGYNLKLSLRANETTNAPAVKQTCVSCWVSMSHFLMLLSRDPLNRYLPLRANDCTPS